MNFDPDAAPQPKPECPITQPIDFSRQAAESVSPIDDIEQIVNEIRSEAAERCRREAIENATRIAAGRAEPGCEGYRVFRAKILLSATVPGKNGNEYFESYDDFASINGGRHLHAARAELFPLFDPIIAHLSSIGFFRADNTARGFMSHDGEDDSPTLYLIAKGIDDLEFDWNIFTALDFEGAETSTFKQICVSVDVVEGGSLTGLFQELGGREPAESVGQCGGEGTPALLPASENDEMLPEWISRLVVPSKTWARTIKRWERSGGKPQLFAKCGSASERATGGKKIDFLIPGTLQRGVITSLVGNRRSGKSTLAAEIAAVLDSEAEGPRSVLGVEVSGRFVVATVSGEDPEEYQDAREKFYEPVHGLPMGFIIDGRGKLLDECLNELRDVPELDLLVIDPAKSFQVGDEDSSNAVSLFYEALNAFAIEKNCAILVVHHLTKAHPPRSLAEMMLRVRGSGVHLDRPRMIWGLLDRGNEISEFGILKHNVPPSERLWGKVNEGRLFRRDAQTLTLVPLETPERLGGAAPTMPAADMHKLILAAIEKITAAGTVIRQTGKFELFEHRLPELVDLSRRILRAEIVALIGAGKLTDGPNGVQIVE